MKRKFLAWLLTIAMVFNMALPYAAFADELPIDTDASYSADEFGATNNDDDATDVGGDSTVDEPTGDGEQGDIQGDEPATDADDDTEYAGEEGALQVGTFATTQGVAAVADTEPAYTFTITADTDAGKTAITTGTKMTTSSVKLTGFIKGSNNLSIDTKYSFVTTNGSAKINNETALADLQGVAVTIDNKTVSKYIGTDFEYTDVKLADTGVLSYVSVKSFSNTKGDFPQKIVLTFNNTDLQMSSLMTDKNIYIKYLFEIIPKATLTASAGDNGSVLATELVKNQTDNTSLYKVYVKPTDTESKRYWPVSYTIGSRTVQLAKADLQSATYDGTACYYFEVAVGENSTAVVNFAEWQNDAPAITGDKTATASIKQGATYSDINNSLITGKFTDADGDTLSYAYRVYKQGDAAQESWTTVESGKGISYKPEAVGTYLIELKANDGTADSADYYTVTLTVVENKAPVLNATDKTASVEVMVTLPYTLSLPALFTDADDKKFTINQKIDDGEETRHAKVYGGTGSVNYTNTWNEPGTHTLVFTADDGNSRSEAFTVNVTVKAGDIDAAVWDGLADTTWYNTDGTEFTLTKPAQLAGLAAIVNGTAASIDKDDFAGKTVKLGNDIVLNDASFEYLPKVNRVKISDGTTTEYMGLSGKGTSKTAPENTNLRMYTSDTGDDYRTISNLHLSSWTAIGNASNAFKGTFDGCGHAIKGLYAAGTNLQYQGLFGNVCGTVQNVTVSGLVGGNWYISGVVAYSEGGVVKNCTNEATVVGFTSNNQTSNGKYVGGIVGMYDSAKADFFGSSLLNKGAVMGSTDVGGIIGHIESKDGHKAALDDCMNTGMVSGYTLANAWTSDVGGIVGYAYIRTSANITDDEYIVSFSKLANRHNINELDKEKYNDKVGGIIGHLKAEGAPARVDSCYNIGDVSGRVDVGGILGFFVFVNGHPSAMANCYNAGMVNIALDITATVNTNSFRNYGSLIGHMEDNITDRNGTAENMYYVSGTHTYDVTKYDDKLIKVTARELKATDFVVNLGENFAPDRNKINKNYPILVGEAEGNNVKDITALTLGDKAGVIDGTTIAIDNYSVIAEGDTIKLKPIVTVAEGVTVSPASGAEAEFKQDADDRAKYTCQYVTTAQNGSMRTYTVAVNTQANVTGVTLDKTGIELVATYGTETLTPVITPVNATNRNVSWKSDDTSIATVDENGVVSGVAAGSTTITVTTEDGSKTATCTVTVTPFIPVTGVSLPETANVVAGKTITLTPVFTPENASNKEVTWTNGNKGEVAKVDENGVVTGKAAKVGQSETVTVTTKDGSFKATCTVTVVKLDVESLSLAKIAKVAVGKAKYLASAFTPADATNQKITWQSSNPDVATVADGVVTGVATGEVTITAIAQDNESISASVTLNVVDDYDYDVEWAGVFNANDANNNVAPATLPTGDTIVEEAWSAPVNNSAVAVIGDYVYAYACAYGMTDDFFMDGEPHTFYKVDKETGKIVATIEDCPFVGGFYYAYIIYGDGIIYVSTPKGLMAFDIDAFEMLWATSANNGIYCAAQYINGKVLVNGNVYNGQTGALEKTLDGNYGYASGAVVGDKYYIAEVNKNLESSNLYVFDTATWTKQEEMTYKTKSVAKSDSTVLTSPGVLYHKGRLWWGDGVDSNALYTVAVNSDGTLDKTSFKTIETIQATRCAPVAYGNRIYLAGQGGAIEVFDATTCEKIYQAGAGLMKIQSTPLICADKDGNVYVYVQAYYGSSLYVLKDTSNATSGELKYLATPSLAQYAFEQMACDADGALYATNDTGNLFKFVALNANLPQITKNLSTDPVTYTKGAKAEALKIEATVEGGDTLSYQWQSSANDVESEYADIEGATGSSYTPDVSKVGTTFYRCKVFSSASTKAYVPSAVAQIRVEEAGSTGGGTVTPSEKTVPVTINFSMDGELVVHNARLNVRDTDGDKKFTMHDAFYVLHEEYDDVDNYDGAANGWVTKFWGDTSMNFGYTQNYKWVFGANQVINSGDKLDVFIYQDTSDEYSDLLAWFAKDSYSGKTGSEITFTVNGMNVFASGENNKQVAAVPVGATVTISKDGDEIATTTTDEKGQFKLSFPDAGVYTIDVTGTCDYTCKSYSGSTTSYTDAPVVPCRCTVSISGTSTGGGIGGAETTETKYTATEVIDLIDAIGTVTKESKSAIEKARTAYDSLTEAQQKKVTNYDKLTAAEAKYTELTGEKIEVSTGDLPFVDVTKGSWYYDAIKAMYDKGLMNGESATKFMPNNKLSRAMLVTILYRMQSEPTVTANALFDDVAADQWYTKAVAWASANNIVSGVGDGKFAPNDSITRQELAAMLYRYANATGLNTTATANLSSFSDSNSVAAWAETAMQWAVGCGLIKGDEDGALNPTGTATRAEVATVIVRLLEMSVR